MNLKIRRKLNPLTKLSVFGIILGSILALLGSFIGALWLAIISGLSIRYDGALFLIHPDLQIFGFLNLFIMSVSYTLIPRFKNKSLDRIDLAYLSIILVFIGNLFIIFSVTLAKDFLRALDGSLLIFLGDLIFAIIMLRTLGKPSGPLALAEPFMSLGIIDLILAAFGKVISEAPFGLTTFIYRNPGFLQFLLLGFPCMMIFGVMVRTVHFRIAHLRRNFVKMAFILLAITNALSFSSFLRGDLKFLSFSSLFFLLGSLIFLFSLDAFKRITRGPIIDRMSERDRMRYLYFSKVTLVASLWLILASIFGFFYSFFLEFGSLNSFFLRDSFIHALTVGFIASTIIAYGPILLPPILFNKTPYKGLSLIPLYLITLGNGWRIIGTMLQHFFSINFLPNAYSGAFVLASMILFLYMIHSLRS
ncbi:MAG: hypothetical protein QXX95_02840 [Nitrososphaerales archaeon]